MSSTTDRDELEAIGVEAFTYLYPLVLMNRTCQQLTNVERVGEKLGCLDGTDERAGGHHVGSRHRRGDMDHVEADHLLSLRLALPHIENRLS